MDPVSRPLASELLLDMCMLCFGQGLSLGSVSLRRPHFMDLHCSGCGNFSVHEPLRGRFLVEDTDQHLSEETYHLQNLADEAAHVIWDGCSQCMPRMLCLHFC